MANENEYEKKLLRETIKIFIKRKLIEGGAVAILAFWFFYLAPLIMGWINPALESWARCSSGFMLTLIISFVAFLMWLVISDNWEKSKYKARQKLGGGA